MATADLLVELMFFWIEKRENCAKQLKKLADELKTLRKKCNTAECVGSTVSVVGAASLIGAGLVTVFTAGAAAPFLAVLGGLYGGVGVAVSVTAKIIEHFSSSKTLKDAEKIEEKNNEIAERIQNLFEKLKVEVAEMFLSADPDQVDRHVMASFMGAVARRSGLKLNIDFSQYESFYPTELGLRQNSTNTFAIIAGPIIVYGIFTVFSLRTSGKQSKLLIAAATKRLIKEMSAAGLKTAMKGGAMVVGGAVGMGFALPEAIGNWKDMIKNNHETEASRSLRDTADDILKNCSTLKKQFDTIRITLEDLAEVKGIIESSDRSDEEKRRLMAYIINKCPNEKVKKWLKQYLQELVVLPLVDMYKFPIKELKKKKEIDRTDIDIIFVAHGGTHSFMFPADCLMPLPSIRDVVLYSPWNCAINADVAYGVATGSIQPHHRVFGCSLPQPEQPEQSEQPEQPEEYCPYPDKFHQPTNLPNRWNSMREAGRLRIPNIFLSPLKEPEDPAWNDFVFLQDSLGEPGRNRVLIPFTRQGWMGSFENIPFLIFTLVLSVVLYVFGCRATVHLAACLSRSEDLNEAELKRQYEYTIDNTGMGSWEERIRNIYDALYKYFKDVFG